MTMTEEEFDEAYEAAISTLSKNLQDLTSLCALHQNLDQYGDPLLIEWTVVAYAEHPAQKRVDEDGDELDDYYSFHSPSIASHRAEGLLRQSLRRIERGL